MAAVAFELTPLSGLRARDLERWRELAAAAAEPNPFFEPEFLLGLARALGALDDVALAVARDGCSWAACMPVQPMRRWSRIPLPALVSWRGRGYLPALLGTPLVSRERLEEAPTALLDGLARVPGCAFVVLECLVGGGPVLAAVASAIERLGLRAMRFEQVDRAFLERRPGGDYLEQAMSKRHRRHLRGQLRRLAAELGSEPAVVELAGEQRAVRRLIELEGASRLAERGTVLAADPALARFFAEMCEDFAALGRLQLLALQAGPRIVAMKASILAGPGLFYLKIAYDESCARFSPGMQLEAAALTLFHERSGLQWIDSCASPNNDTFNRLMPGRRTLVTLAVLRRDARSLAAGPMIGVARRVRARRRARSAAG